MLYVNAAGSDANARASSGELFSVADIQKMRILISVPQDYSAMLKPGLIAILSSPQFPGRSCTAALDTTANAFHEQTPTILTELTVGNPNRTIWPGTCTAVHFTADGDPNLSIVPEQALLSGAGGMQPAPVGPDRKVHLQTVEVGLNPGRTVQMRAGLKLADRLIDNPSAGLTDGETVDVVQAAASVPRLPTPPAVEPTMISAQRVKIEAAREGASEWRSRTE